MPDNNQTRTQLIYDGDCGICRYWVNYWQSLTGNTVEYLPYQQVLQNFPGIPEEEFRQSIQLISDNQSRKTGADAVYTLLKKHFPYNLLYRCYQYIPGFSWCAEQGYSFFSHHRGLLKWISYCLWGKQLLPARYELVSGLYRRLLGVIYLLAFASLAIQITGLAGNNGILPVTDFLQRSMEQSGYVAWLKIPTIFWLNSTDIFLQAACLLGVASSFFIIFNYYTRVALLVNFILYLSLFYACQVFLQFQWDLLLLECGFLAIFLGHGKWIIVALYRWLLFRFMLLGGLVKLFSGDTAWDNLTALSYHFETQPLPTPLAWYAHHLPDTILVSLTATTLIIELVLPFFLLAPRNIRMVVGWVFILFQTGIILTGNYNFFNLLTIITCLFLFDDRALQNVIPAGARNYLAITPAIKPGPVIVAGITSLVLCMSIAQLWQIAAGGHIPVLSAINRSLSSLRIVNQYGPFAVMTRTRHEIIIQGSDDGKNWQSYKFKYNPDDLRERPQWIIPHQPRLDWQMWFAALSRPGQNPWFIYFLKRLLEGDIPVTNLLEYNPFSDQPPAYVRAMMYEYHFSDPQTRKQHQLWWSRELKGLYFPATKLVDGQLQVVR